MDTLPPLHAQRVGTGPQVRSSDSLLGESDCTVGRRKQSAWNHPSQPASGFLCPRLLELPWLLASQICLLNTSSNSLHLLYAKDTGYFLSPHLSLLESASRTCHESRCVSHNFTGPSFPALAPALVPPGDSFVLSTPWKLLCSQPSFSHPGLLSGECSIPILHTSE